ncbi:MAG TPA: histidine kinase [Rhizomicrobium sp.]
MSLQLRIIGSIAVLLCLSLAAGAALLSSHAQDVVLLEVRTAFQGAERSVRDTLQSDVEHTVTLRQVVASFQGQRHVRAALVNEKGKIIVQSQIATIANPAPAWFARVMAPPRFSARIPISLPQYPCVVVLSSDPRAEVAEVWNSVRDAFLIMAIFCVVTVAAVTLATVAASRFLHKIQSGLLAVAEGGYDTRLNTEGPPEFANLARGFNHMANQLSAFSRTNGQLYTQLRNTQDEERGSIARDLHDEVGPYLFAIQVDANAIGKMAAPEAQRLSQSIRETVGHIQHHVRSILRQLRPVSQLEFGLETAIDDIAAFWKRRHPEIGFQLEIALPERVGRQYEEAIFRVVQESVSNAVRHGTPSCIRIMLQSRARMLTVTVEDDGGGVSSNASLDASLGQVGIAGMRERVLALKGRFSVEPIDRQGLRVRAELPLAQEIVPA